jgi:16S rRNA (cytosine967-C5)-methyltransferase
VSSTKHTRSEQKQYRQPSVSPSRRLAFDILERVATEEAYASTLLAAPSTLTQVDHALAQELVLGILRWQQRLDFYIEQLSGRSIKKIDLPVLLALRLGLYQLHYLSRIPPSAAVNESVNLVKLARKTSAAAFTNAILRRATKNFPEDAIVTIAEPLTRLAVELSHPRWLIEKWLEEFGETTTKELAQANNQTPPVAFRINTLKADVAETLKAIDAAGVSYRHSELAADAYVVTGGHAAALGRFAEAGLIYLQDEASQLVALLLAATPASHILDLCAAPGSKTTHLAALTKNQAPILACDLHPHRLAVLQANCQRLGVTSVKTLALDAAGDVAPLAGMTFDRILIDAPCTGTGTLRRHPEIKWRLRETDPERLAGIQSKLLENGAKLLSAGGRLVYSTCSLERQENEEVIARFLERHREFQIASPAAPASCITADGFVRTFPHLHHSDGFFAAVFEQGKKKDSEEVA